MGGDLVNLAEFAFDAGARLGARPALTDLGTGTSLDYRGLALEVERVAGFLRLQGVGPAARIGLAAPNGVAYVPIALGVLAAGACLVPVPLGLAPSEVRRILTDIHVNGLLVWPEGPRLTRSGVTMSEGVGAGFSFEWTAREAVAPAGFAELNPAFVRFTSGTTAESKGVILSHEATAARAAAANAVLGVTEGDRVLWVLPLAYHFAVTMTAYVRAGCHVLLGSDTSPVAVGQALSSEKATVFYASPLHFARLVGLGGRRDLPHLRLALSTTAPLPADVARGFEEHFGLALGQAYGVIELGLPCINRGSDGLPPTSVGRPVPDYEVRVLDEDGRCLPAGSDGEVAVAGPGLFSGYYAPWRPLSAVLRNGLFHTGDIGRMDASGALELKGRKKACLSVAGMKFFPEEIESCINSFPGIRESRVFGQVHHRLGQVPHAEVVLDCPAPLDTKALRAHCALSLSPLKVPVEFTVVATIPKTAGGKILRRGVKD